jgi:hypothetical protein
MVIIAFWYYICMYVLNPKTMKTLILSVILSLFLFSCQKEDTKAPFHLAPNAQVLIKPVSSVLRSGSTEHLSDKEIVKQCIMISFYNIPTFGNQAADCGFSEAQKDSLSNPPCLKRWATDLIAVDGSGKYYLVPDFIYATDLVFCRVYNNKRDTIAYTPNATIKQMEIDIKAALAAQDTVLAYQVFNNRFTFTPITGSEWRALKAQNQQ